MQLAAGRLLIYPTETLYAIGGRARDARAGLAVREAKGRDDTKPLPLVAADLGQVHDLTSSLPDAASRLAEVFWPGPLTLVMEARHSVPVAVTSGSGSVAVRVPSSALCRALCAHGPLVSTSANLSGGPSPYTCDEALAQVGRHAALALDAGPGGRTASTIVDVRGPRPLLLREGAVPFADVLRSLGLESA